jgi:hypothetical protein
MALMKCVTMAVMEWLTIYQNRVKLYRHQEGSQKFVVFLLLWHMKLKWGPRLCPLLLTYTRESCLNKAVVVAQQQVKLTHAALHDLDLFYYVDIGLIYHKPKFILQEAY